MSVTSDVPTRPPLGALARRGARRATGRAPQVGPKLGSQAGPRPIPGSRVPTWRVFKVTDSEFTAQTIRPGLPSRPRILKRTADTPTGREDPYVGEGMVNGQRYGGVALVRQRTITAQVADYDRYDRIRKDKR